jgi:hypothetical protein
MTQKIDKPATRGPGRPPRADGAATKAIPVRVTDAEYESARALAEARGVDLSTLIRNLLAAAAKRTRTTTKPAKGRR